MREEALKELDDKLRIIVGSISQFYYVDKHIASD